jgi:putative transposase
MRTLNKGGSANYFQLSWERTIRGKGSVPRLPRFFVKGVPQHIVQRGINMKTVFTSDADFRFYRECLMEAAQRCGCSIHAYALMNNRIHLLATPSDSHGVPKTLQSIGRRYVQYFNKTYHRSGTLWDGRYRAALIDAKGYLLGCMRYVERMPLREGIVKSLEDYPWSSFRANALGESDALIEPHAVYLGLGATKHERLAVYRQLCGQPLSEAERTAINEATHKGWALGNEAFRKRIETLTGTRAGPLRRGRPKKSSPPTD